MQPPQPTVRQTSASDRYRRAIRCLMGSADPLNDMSEGDKNQVLGIIADLEVADWAEQQTILDEVFEGRADARKEFHDAATENIKESREVAAEHRVAFLEALRTEVELIWAEKIERAADATDEPEADDEPATTVPGGSGPR